MNAITFAVNVLTSVIGGTEEPKKKAPHVGSSSQRGFFFWFRDEPNHLIVNYIILSLNPFRKNSL